MTSSIVSDSCFIPELATIIFILFPEFAYLAVFELSYKLALDV